MKKSFNTENSKGKCFNIRQRFNIGKYSAMFLAVLLAVLSLSACSNNEELTPIDVEGQTEIAPETVAAPEEINLDAIMETETEAETETEPETETETAAPETKKETKAANKETKAEKKETKAETKAEETKAETKAEETKAETKAETAAETMAENIAVAETDASGYVTAVDEGESLTPGQTGGPSGSDSSSTSSGDNAPGSSTSGSSSPSGGSDVIYVEKGPGE